MDLNEFIFSNGRTYKSLCMCVCVCLYVCVCVSRLHSINAS